MHGEKIERVNTEIEQSPVCRKEKYTTSSNNYNTRGAPDPDKRIGYRSLRGKRISPPPNTHTHIHTFSLSLSPLSYQNADADKSAMVEPLEMLLYNNFRPYLSFTTFIFPYQHLPRITSCLINTALLLGLFLEQGFHLH